MTRTKTDPEELAFRRALKAEPKDLVTVRAYADWLTDRGRRCDSARLLAKHGLAEVRYRLRRKSTGEYIEGFDYAGKSYVRTKISYHADKYAPDVRPRGTLAGYPVYFRSETPRPRQQWTYAKIPLTDLELVTVVLHAEVVAAEPA